MIKENPLNSQVGGSHYKKYRIQPVEYAMANNLNYCQANAIKYVTRYRDKNGIEDLRKAIHNIEILIELENDQRYQPVSVEAASEDSSPEPDSKRFDATVVSESYCSCKTTAPIR